VTWIIGHRGASRQRQENSLAAFRLALAQGADGVELDIHEHRDGRFLVHHDPVTVAPPASLTARETAGQPTEPEAPAVPELGRALAAIVAARDRAVVFVEVKTLRSWSRLLAVLEPFRARLRLEVQSGDRGILREAAAAPGGHRLGLIAETPPPGDVAAWLLAHRLQALSLRHDAARRELADELHAAGLALHLWTVNDPAAAQAAVALGADSIITDVPGRLRAYTIGP